MGMQCRVKQGLTSPALLYIAAEGFYNLSIPTEGTGRSLYILTTT